MRVLPPSDAIAAAIAAIAERPHGASALTLYALANTLDFQRAGCLFKLAKLRDLDPAHRPIAYGLMEALATGQVGDADWQRAKSRMDALIRNG